RATQGRILPMSPGLKRSAFCFCTAVTFLSAISGRVIAEGFSSSTYDGGATNVGTHSSIKLDSQGQPHITYYQDNGVEMKYTHLVGSTWVTEVARNSGGINTSLALDGSDQPHVALYDPALPALVYARKAASTWLFESVAGIRQIGAGQSSLILDGPG